MKIGLLLENLLNIHDEAADLGLTEEQLYNMEVIERNGAKIFISESIQLKLAKDDKGNYFILKENYGTPEDRIAKLNQATKYL